VGVFSFDESIHTRGSFILGAWVYSEENTDEDVEAALRKNGLTPGVDEFKSSAHMGRNPEQARLREGLAGVLQRCRIGVVVVPAGDRRLLGAEACRGLLKIIHNNGLISTRHDASFDEGIFQSVDRGCKVARELGLDRLCNLHFEQDSRRVLGLQLADLAAHTCATMLLEALGLVNKTVRAGENSGYDPEMPVEIGFELWARIRYSLFCSDSAPLKDLLTGATSPEEISYPEFDISACALHVADSCPEPLRSAAFGRFGLNYLGCIH
jgi:hypothetical protein